MNYIEQIINLDIENIEESNHQKISEIFKDLKNKGHKNIESYYVVFPFAIKNNPPYKPMLYNDFLNSYTYGKDVKKFLAEDNKVKSIFTYDNETGEIREVEGNDLRWINYEQHLSNFKFDSVEYNNFLNQTKESLLKLIKTLPDDITKIKKLYYKGEYNEQSFTTYPLVNLITRFKNPQIFEFILKEYPQIKEYFDHNSNYNKHHVKFKTPSTLIFSKLMLSEVRHTMFENDYCYIALKENLIKKEDLSLEDGYLVKEQLYLGVRKAIVKNDINLLNKVLEDDTYLSILKKISNEDKSVDSKLPCYVKSVEVGNLLKNKGFNFFSIDNRETLSNDEAIKKINDYKESKTKNLGIAPFGIIHNADNSYKKIEALLKLFPEINDEKVLDNFMPTIFSESNLELLGTIMKKLDKINLAKYDIFLHLLYKNAPIEMYKEAIELGADPRNCEKFIEKVINSKDSLKCIKLLNKEGIVLSRNPDYLFHVLRNNTTKSNLAYFEKNIEDICSKYTLEGNLAWWGANNLDSFKWMLSKSSNLTQNGKDNQSILYYYAKLNTERRVELYIEKVIDTLNNAHNQFENLKINIEYINEENGNHLLHELCNINVFNSGLMNVNVINKVEQISEQSLSKFINLKNKNGLTPIEFLVNGIKNEKSDLIRAKRANLLNYLIEKYQSSIILNTFNEEGVELVNSVLECVTEDIKPIVEKIYMGNITSLSKVKKNMLKF